MSILGHPIFLGALRATVFVLESHYETTKIPPGALRAPIITHAKPPERFLGRSWDLGQAESEGYKGVGVGHGIGESWGIYDRGVGT